ncbi:MAG: sigma-70 family RNA polymerase sigma factor [Candidatus Omnitrophica bacterium]|nr:sigma-70 family RNA polymerase sigma factor [Candidatus Omnitrophota bacterium]
MVFEAFLRRLSATIRRIAYKLNRYPAYFNDEDLYQEAIIHLWQDFNLGKLMGKTDSYILQGCYFHLKNYIRKHREKAVRVSLDEMIFDEKNGFTREEVLLIEPRNGVSHYDFYNNRLLADTIRNNGLTTREKLILSFCSDGLTMREIGKQIGVSHVSVVKSLKIIRAKCQKYLDKE